VNCGGPGVTSPKFLERLQPEEKRRREDVGRGGKNCSAVIIFGSGI